MRCGLAALLFLSACAPAPVPATSTAPMASARPAPQAASPSTSSTVAPSAAPATTPPAATSASAAPSRAHLVIPCGGYSCNDDRICVLPDPRDRRLGGCHPNPCAGELACGCAAKLCPAGTDCSAKGRTVWCWAR